jgi:DNA polymerase
MIIDFETFSEANVKEVGAVRYAQHPSTEPLCMSHGLKGVKKKIWVPPNPFPQEVIDHVLAGGYLEAHHAAFERAIWYYVLYLKMGVVSVLPTRWKDTLAVCAYRALPLGLDAVGEVLDLDVKKDKRGKYLLDKLCKPQKPTKNDPRTRIDDYDLLEELYDYCITDGEAEDDLGDRIGELPDPEQRIWVLDQIINQRGVYLDVEAVRAAKGIVTLVTNKLTSELIEITEGKVKTGSEVKKIREWLDEHEVPTFDLTKGTVEDTLKRLRAAAKEGAEWDDQIRVLEIRQQLGRASVKKLDKMLDCVCEDGKLHGMMQYHGASTGRFAGRLVQPHNFTRGTIKDVDTLIKFIRIGGQEGLDALTMMYGDPMEAISSSLRSMLTASLGNILRVADFKAIEARGVMWLAGQEDALEAFRQYDKGIGPDIYCVMAEKIFNRPIDKKEDPEERQMGKITILGCGYQMWWPRLQSQALDEFKTVVSDDDAELMVVTYRSDYNQVPALWRGLENAAGSAIEHPGNTYQYGYISYRMIEDAAGPWLECGLPNGRSIWYFRPEVATVEKWGRESYEITYQGKNSKKQGAWDTVYTYGGMLTENVTQAISRDIMVESMIRVEQAGYPIILTVHDEDVADVPLDHGSQEEFETLMAIPPAWARDLPVAVDGWAGHRYKKG